MERARLMSIEHVTRTHIGCRRKDNEDAVLARLDQRLWAVADGMGGHEGGEFASALLMKKLGECPAHGDLASRSAAALGAVEAANAELFALGAGGARGRTIGSTIVVLLIDEGRFTCLWAGDSRAYLARGDDILQLTRDHSLVQELVDAGHITPAEALSHPNGNIVTRAAGAAARINVARLDGEARSTDAFLLATDGLTRLMDDAELYRSLGATDLETAADGLVETCLARGAPDNVSFIMIRSAGR
jgi:serine/threonine-protein phosphatase Stp1